MCTTLTPFIYWNLRVSIKERTNPKKCQEFENFITLKQFIKCYKAVDFPPIFNNIFTANILGMWGKRRGFTSHAGVVINVTINVLTFLKQKLMIMIEHIKMMAIPYLDILSMLLSGQVPHRSNPQCHLFRNLKDPVLVQTLYFTRKITHHLLLIGFFHKLISVPDVGHNMLHLHVAQQLPSLYMHQWIICPTKWQWCWAEQTISIWHWSKQNIARLTQVKDKTEKPAIQFSQYT